MNSVHELDAEAWLSERVRRRPYTTIGAAAGLGYMFGSGLRSQFTVVLLGGVARLAAALVLRELAEIASHQNAREFRSTSLPATGA